MTFALFQKAFQGHHVTVCGPVRIDGSGKTLPGQSSTLGNGSDGIVCVRGSEQTGVKVTLTVNQNKLQASYPGTETLIPATIGYLKTSIS